MIRRLDFSQSHALLQSGKSLVLLDVREEEEFITGHVPGAVLLPVDTIDKETAAAAIPALDTPVMVYCRSGKRSIRAALMLDRLGYKDIYDMGGLAGWPYELE